MPAISPLFLLLLIVCIVSFILGINICFFLFSSISFETQQKLDLLKTLTETQYNGQDDKIVSQILDEVSASKIKDNLKFLSLELHLAGTPRNQDLAFYIKNLWLEHGLDQVYLVPYQVLLSSSNLKNPNRVQLVDESGEIVFQSRHQETGSKDQLNSIPAYHGYSPQGDVTGEPIYCNYGRTSDFDLLESYLLNLTGKICIMRYGKIYRGNKCDEAAKRGCVGCIMYSDPFEVARNGTENSDVYPNTWWMPGDVIQRGSVGLNAGDPLTPGFPSVEGAFRYQTKDIKLPKIPSQPIGYDDALKILEIMGGNSGKYLSESLPESFSDWPGGLNISYYLGPGFNSQNANKKLRLIVNNELERKTIYNVIGVLNGSLEPDRYVILGNHRDAWGFGAVDPSSGGAALLEVTRVLGKLHKENGWKPRRTMVFASWDAEEFGLIGSTEWVEEHINLLTERAVAYINVDTFILGPIFQPDASSALMEVIRQVSKTIPFVKQSNHSLYQSWLQHQTDVDKPRISTLGSGTDHAPFAFFAGIPSIYIEFSFDKKKYPISGYPAYHTYYDSFDLVEQFIDPDFELHACGSKLMATLMHVIADSTLLPYDFKEMAQRLQEDYDNLWTNQNLVILTKSNLIQGVGENLIKMFETSMKNLSNAANDWSANMKRVNLNNPLEVRQMNDLMMAVERSFIKAEGFDERLEVRHVLYAPSKHNTYAKTAFPGLLDLMYKVENWESREEKNATEQLNNWNLLKKHISDVAIVIRRASRLLRGDSFEI